MRSGQRPRFCWRLRSRNLNLGTRTLVMGILNVTPDSFSDGGQFLEVEAAVARGLAMLEDGADLIDVGGESTRPGAAAVNAAEEQERVLAVIEKIIVLRPEAAISIDTYHSSTARMAVAAGAEIVNDVSGGLWDEGMLAACAEMGCGLVLMHTRGTPGGMGGSSGSDRRRGNAAGTGGTGGAGGESFRDRGGAGLACP